MLVWRSDNAISTKDVHALHILEYVNGVIKNYNSQSNVIFDCIV